MEAGACFSAQQFDALEQKAILTWLWWQWAESVDNDVNYTTVDQILAAAECLRNLSANEKTTALIAIMNRGEDSFGSLTAEEEIVVLTADTAATAIACLKQLPGEALDAIILLNQCRFFKSFTS